MRDMPRLSILDLYEIGKNKNSLYMPYVKDKYVMKKVMLGLVVNSHL